MDCVVALDAGTGSGRCVVYDAHGRPLATARQRFRYRSFAHPDVPFIRGFDLDPTAFLDTLATCTRRALGTLPADARLRGVAVTSQRGGCVFLDATGTVLYAGPNLDARATVEGFELHERLGTKRLHAITGHLPACVFAAARYRWFRTHGDATRIRHVLMLSDWITHRLTATAVAEPSNAAESMLFDVTARGWSHELVDALELPPEVLPPLLASGALAGHVTAEAATATGLPAGLPVFTGGADTQCALLGSGAHRDGDTAAIIGTTCPVQMVTDAPVLDPAANLWTGCHVVPGRWVLESNAGEAGGAYRWLLRLVYGAADDAAHAAAAEAVAAESAGQRQVLSFLGPLVFDLRQMNPFRPAGLLFRFPILHLDRPDRGDVLHGFLENVAFAIRANVEQLATTSGRTPARLHASGGMAQSGPLVQLLADTLALPVVLPAVLETASLGCAMLAATGAGLHPSLAAAGSAMTTTRQVEPTASGAPRAAERYGRWRELYTSLAGMVV